MKEEDFTQRRKENAKTQKDFHFAPLRELCGFA